MYNIVINSTGSQILKVLIVCKKNALTCLPLATDIRRYTACAQTTAQQSGVFTRTRCDCVF